jgi:hypothetical protein
LKEKVIFMRKKLILLLTVIMILALAVCMPSCGKKDAGDQAADAGAATEQGEGTEEPARTVVKTIEGIDEDELFREIEESSPGHGMTIAPPADKESEIEALRRRLVELTGTIDKYELEAAEKAAETVEKAVKARGKKKE